MYVYIYAYMNERGLQSEHNTTSVPYFLMHNLKTTLCNIPSKFVHTLSCVLCVHVCTHVHGDAQEHTWRPEAGSFETGSLTELSTYRLARLAG